MLLYIIILIYIFTAVVFYSTDSKINKLLKSRYPEFWEINKRFKGGIVYYNFIKQIENNEAIINDCKTNISIQKFIFAFYLFSIAAIILYWLYFLVSA
jgi:hypothetical protein